MCSFLSLHRVKHRVGKLLSLEELACSLYGVIPTCELPGNFPRYYHIMNRLIRDVGFTDTAKFSCPIARTGRNVFTT